MYIVGKEHHGRKLSDGNDIGRQQRLAMGDPSRGIFKTALDTFH
jgi:hypothetical protein